MATGGGGEDPAENLNEIPEEDDPGPSKKKKSGGKGQQVAGILRVDTSGAAGSPQRTSRTAGRRKSSSGSADYRNTLNVSFGTFHHSYRTWTNHLQMKAEDNRSPLPSVDRLSVSFVMGESASAGTSSVRADSPVERHPPAAAPPSKHQPHYLDIGRGELYGVVIFIHKIMQRRISGHSLLSHFIVFTSYEDEECYSYPRL